MWDKSSAADENTTIIKKTDKVQRGNKDKLSKCKNLHLKKKKDIKNKGKIKKITFKKSGIDIRFIHISHNKS